MECGVLGGIVAVVELQTVLLAVALAIALLVVVGGLLVMRQTFEWPGPATIAGVAAAVVLLFLQWWVLAAVVVGLTAMGIAAAHFSRQALRWTTVVLILLAVLAAARFATDPGDGSTVEATKLTVTEAQTALDRAKAEEALAKDQAALLKSQIDAGGPVTVQGPDVELEQRALDVANAQATLDEAKKAETKQGIGDDLVGAVEDWTTSAWNTLTNDASKDPSMTAAAWIVLGLVALLVYRRFELQGAAHEPGPITLTEITGDIDEETQKSAAAIFRAHLDRTELRNPPGIPGGAETERIVKVLQEETKDAPGWFGGLSKIASVAVKVVFPTSGYDVTVTIEDCAPTESEEKEEEGEKKDEPTTGLCAQVWECLVALWRKICGSAEQSAADPPEAGDPPPSGPDSSTPLADGGEATGAETADEPDKVRIAYRIASTRSGQVLTAAEFSAADKEPGLRRAAFEVARWVSQCADRTPPWAIWQDAEAWSDYQRLWPGGTGPTSEVSSSDEEGATSKTVEELARILRESPGTGIARMALGMAYDDDGSEREATVEGESEGQGDDDNEEDPNGIRYVEALQCFVEVALDHPRLLVNRYRLAVSLAFMATGGGWAKWTATDATTRAIVLDDLERLALLDDEIDAKTEVAQRDRFLAMAARVYDELEGCTVPTLLGWWFLHPKERASHRSALKRTTYVQRRAVVRTAAAITELTRGLRSGTPVEELMPDLAERVEAQVGVRHVGAQARYNAACFYATAAAASTGSHRERCARKAFAHLERHYRDPEGRTVSVSWLAKDPDLAGIRKEPRFKALQHRLEGKTEQTAAEPATTPPSH